MVVQYYSMVGRWKDRPANFNWIVPFLSRCSPPVPVPFSSGRPATYFLGPNRLEHNLQRWPFIHSTASLRVWFVVLFFFLLFTPPCSLSCPCLARLLVIRLAAGLRDSWQEDEDVDNKRQSLTSRRLQKKVPQLCHSGSRGVKHNASGERTDREPEP